jgi:hypothetical protein
MRTTIPKTGHQSAQDSYGLRSHPPQVTGSRLNQRTVVKRGKRIGSKISNECNSCYCRGFAVFGACAARLYSASVSAIISVRPPSPGCSMMLITS